MNSTEVSPWTRRVLNNGVLGIAPEENWKLQAYESYIAKLRAPDFPCFFGQTGEIRGEMIYTFISQRFQQQFVEDMQEFVTLLGTADYERCSLVAFFEPDPKITTHAAFVDRFWELLQMLHKHDSHPALDRTPDDPLWEFSFEGCEMFVVGSSPTYQQRRSRNLGPGIVLIFQPRRLFIDPTTSQPIAAEVRHRIHRRMLAYDGMPVHPDIGFYGQPTNREWKQYALPDDNSPETGSCPFHTRMNALNSSHWIPKKQ
jgi:FPC/CPF motif-containing protein YcgG